MVSPRVLLGLLVAGVVACSSEPAAEEPGEAAETGYEEELKNAEIKGQPSQKWIYAGMLPALEKPEVVASLKAHTVRVTGLLPKAFAGKLPFYAEAAPAGDRTKVTVVYPIATGKVDPSTGKAPAAAGSYTTLFGIAYTPTNDKAPWGGFPFLMYNASRGIAFHGPITSKPDVVTGDLEWILYRGPVSHGCNRMAGEHVVELSHLLGIDMGKPHTISERFTLGVKVTITPEFDTFDARQVDVNYPAEKGVTRPTGPTAKVYPTWLSDDFPRFVCAYQADRPLGPQHCDTAGENRRDPLTGASLAPQASAQPWVGDPCDDAADCGFKAGGKAATCSVGTAGAGLCTVSCEGYCPDSADRSVTFCAAFPDGKGRCVVKADARNASCSAIPGTAAVVASRMIGASGASAAKATVCMPQ